MLEDIREGVYRREVFCTILFYACRSDRGSLLKIPFESRYVWEALARATADHIGCKLPEPSYPLKWMFEKKIWHNLGKELKEKKEDKFLLMLYKLLRTTWNWDRLGDGDYSSEVKEWYKEYNKPLQSVTTLEYAFSRGEMKVLDEDDPIRVKCEDVGRKMRVYLDKQIQYIEKEYLW